MNNSQEVYGVNEEVRLLEEQFLMQKECTDEATPLSSECKQKNHHCL
jgi:hypothetical protein